MKKGIITSNIGKLYSVFVDGKKVYAEARGIFRKDNFELMVGDFVDIRLNDDINIIEKVHERNSKLIRPKIANVSQLVVVVSIKDPKIDLLLLDKIITMAEYSKIRVIVCINKVDLDEIKANEIMQIYKNIGYRVILNSIKFDNGINEIKSILNNNFTAFTGPSGVGKSTILNSLNPNLNLEVGSISSKLKRGKHTTRQNIIFSIDDNTFIFDTPGFSSLTVNFIDNANELDKYFIEINKYKIYCEFTGCNHIKEQNCEVIKKVSEKVINEKRYKNYLSIFNEITKSRRY